MCHQDLQSAQDLQVHTVPSHANRSLQQGIVLRLWLLQLPLLVLLVLLEPPDCHSWGIHAGLYAPAVTCMLESHASYVWRVALA